MPSLLITGDPHLDATTAGIARYDEARRFYDRVAEDAARERVDWIAVLGDAHDPDRALQALYTVALLEISAKLADVASAGLLWIAGNHDVYETMQTIDGEPEPLTTLSPLAAAIGIAGGSHPWGYASRVYERPEYERLGENEYAIDVLALPYVSTAASRVLGEAGMPEAAIAAAEAGRARATKDPADPTPWPPPLVVLGHFTDIPGAVAGDEDTTMARGRRTTFPVREIAALRPALVANGHYHNQQIVDLLGLSILIPGSPARFTFGERNDAFKGYFIVRI